MKERDFIEKNNNRWQAFEAEIKKAKADPRLTTKSYIEMMDDLSYSRTHYPNRLVRSYLNGVAQMLSVIIYRAESNTFKKAKDFWLIDLPLVMYQSRKQLLLAVLVFVAAMGVGIFSSMQDPDFAKTILGEHYVTMTIENIEKGDPMAVYKDQDASGMFLGITTNNILVSIRTFLMGFFFGIGTLLILVYNGVMVGVFQYFFVERGLFFESFLTIWQHGALEISSIVIAGCAGFVLGNGVFFPGSYSRLDALRISGRKSIMIAAGLIPIFIMAGAIESFVTRLTDLHWMLRLATIILSFSFILFYFVIYPMKIAKRFNINKRLKMNTLPIIIESYDRTKIYGLGVTYAQSIWLMLQKSRTLVWGIIALAGSISAFVSLYADDFLKNGYANFTNVFSVGDMTMFGLDIFNFSATSALLVGATFLSARMLSRSLNQGHWIDDLMKYGLWSAITGVVSAFILSSGYSLIIFFVFWPLMQTAIAESIDSKTPVVNVFGTAWSAFKEAFWRHSGNAFIFFVLFFTVNAIYAQLLSPLIQDSITMFIPIDGDIEESVQIFIYELGLMLSLGIVILNWNIVTFYNHFTSKEAYKSQHLRQRAEALFEPKEPIDLANFSKANYHKI